MDLKPECLYRGNKSEIWHADCLNADHVAEVMGRRSADALIFDGPFSEKTHQGHKNGKLTADSAAAFAARHADKPTKESRYAARKSEAGESGRHDIEYEAWADSHIFQFCDVWKLHNHGWCVSLTDDVLAPIWGAQFEKLGLYRFAPIALVETGSRVRMTGDGPANWCCWIVPARPRGGIYAKYGALPGGYVVPGERIQNTKLGTDRIVGGKPLKAMIEIVSDYSRPGDLVVDPTCGGCTTGQACARTGRRFIGIEKDRGRAELCAEVMQAEEAMSNRREMNAGQEALFR